MKTSETVFTVAEEVSRVFAIYYRLHGVRVSLFEPDGSRVYPDDSQPDCRFCSLLRRDGKRDLQCRQLDREMVEKSIREDRVIRYRCHAGLQEVAMPLKSGGEIIGCMMAGQFRRRGDRPDAGIAAKGFSGPAGGQLKEAYQAVPEYEEEKIPVLMDLYREILETINSRRLIEKGPHRQLGKVMRRVEAEPATRISLEGAAELSGLSVTAFSRHFHRVTGRSWQQWNTEFRLELAERLMVDRGDLRIAEIARRCGYEDPLYFSRLYRKHRGQSPRDYRRSLTGMEN